MAKAGRGGPCAACKGGNCEGCIDSPENSTPIKLYTPKGAARAMLAGKVLKDTQGRDHFWNNAITVQNHQPGFYYMDKKGDLHPCNEFSGLYMEI